MKKIAVIGGGMAGIIAAINAKNDNNVIDLYERQDKLSKKIALTGNGRCNITNDNIDISNYICDDISKLEDILDAYDQGMERLYLKKLGLFVKNVNGYIYPYSNQASTVINVLNRAIVNKGINVFLNSYIDRIEYDKEKYIINDIQYDYVVLACGGMAGVYRENEFNGYKTVRKLGHSANYCYPALCPVKCAGMDFKRVSGIRCEAKISLALDEDIISFESGELQLTDYGLSGIPIFQLSRYIGKILDDKKKPYFIVDFMPGETADAICNQLESMFIKHNDLTWTELLYGLVNDKLSKGLLFEQGINPDSVVNLELLNHYINTIKIYRVDIVSLNNFKSAQISTGGVPLSEVSSKLESLICPNMFILGEMLDVSGMCGGYNLHFASATGYIAGNTIKERTK